VLCKCIDLLKDEAEFFVIEEIFLEWTRRFPASLCAAVLRNPFDSPLRIQRANEVLSSWQRHHRRLVTAALTVYQNSPERVEKYCRAILQRWKAEINYKIKNQQKRYDGHIINSLCHPGLRRLARKVVQEMLAMEAKQPGLLSNELHELVIKIKEEQWPPWCNAEEKKMHMNYGLKIH